MQLRDVSALPVPEPGTLIMVGAGASGLVIRRKGRRDPAWRPRILTRGTSAERDPRGGRVRDGWLRAMTLSRNVGSSVQPDAWDPPKEDF